MTSMLCGPHPPYAARPRPKTETGVLRLLAIRMTVARLAAKTEVAGALGAGARALPAALPTDSAWGHLGWVAGKARRVTLAGRVRGAIVTTGPIRAHAPTDRPPIRNPTQ